MMQEVVANFIIENPQSICVDYDIAQDEAVATNFTINATPSKVSQLDNDLGYQTEQQVKALINTYTHEQAIASDTWIIRHNLGKYPSIYVVDSAGVVQIPNDIIIDNENQITVQFISAFAGKAYLN